MVAALLDAGAEREALDDGNKTALHYAASRGHTQVVKVLIARGSIVDAQSAQKVTALQMAAEKAHVEVIKALLAAGANVAAQADDGKMAPLHAVCYSSHV